MLKIWQVDVDKNIWRKYRVAIVVCIAVTLFLIFISSLKNKESHPLLFLLFLAVIMLPGVVLTKEVYKIEFEEETNEVIIYTINGLWMRSVVTYALNNTDVEYKKLRNTGRSPLLWTLTLSPDRGKSYSLSDTDFGWKEDVLEEIYNTLLTASKK